MRASVVAFSRIRCNIFDQYFLTGCNLAGFSSLAVLTPFSRTFCCNLASVSCLAVITPFSRLSKYVAVLPSLRSF